MAITKSAKKAHRRSLRRGVFNIRRKEAFREAVKEVKSAIGGSASGGKAKDIDKLLSVAYRAIDKAAKPNVISKNTAARTKSRLAAAIRRIAK